MVEFIVFIASYADVVLAVFVVGGTLLMCCLFLGCLILDIFGD